VGIYRDRKQREKETERGTEIYKREENVERERDNRERETMGGEEDKKKRKDWGGERSREYKGEDEEIILRKEK
jgi:hypothetical protein